MTSTSPDDDKGLGTLTRALGGASVALGVPPLLRPEMIVRAIGVGDGPKQRMLATAVGARELLSAAGLLLPVVGGPAWVWTRVAGDAMDLSVLGLALSRHDGKGLRRTIATTAIVAGITAVDVYAAVRHAKAVRRGSGIELTASTTVRKSPDEVYGYWRRLDQLPTFMAHVDEVRIDGDSRSHWSVSAPFGRHVEWDAEITQDVPGSRLAWSSINGAKIKNAGAVRFSPAPRDQGTEVHVTLTYRAPGGKLGEALARWAGENPRQQLDDDLRRFKQVLETGEVTRSEGAPWGKRARKEFPQRPAQPLTPKEVIDLTSAESRNEVRA
jgi:uncharacterized membrane protein